jgi:hypothetical protein
MLACQPVRCRAEREPPSSRSLCRRTVRLSDVVDKLHDQHGLADTGTAEQTNLATTLVRRQQVHDLRAAIRRPTPPRVSGACTGLHLPSAHSSIPSSSPQQQPCTMPVRTLMPVTRISCSVLCSVNSGASRWMDHTSAASALQPCTTGAQVSLPYVHAEYWVARGGG